MEEVILVDEQDAQVGKMEKLEAHKKALLHRAFSVFVFNSKGEMLMQQRAYAKYHSGGLWTNACCSHPRPGEETLQAAERRLKEEMGFNTPLKKVFHFTYKAHFDNGLTEHEFDHVFVGNFDGEAKPSVDEVRDHCYKSMEEIDMDIKTKPNIFTAWFHIAFPKVFEWSKQQLVTSEFR